MEKKKLDLQELKIESFLTELDESKLNKIHGGKLFSENGGCESGDSECPACTDPDKTTNDNYTRDDKCPGDDGPTKPGFGIN
ncbi:pinensin family lanthipeptide [Chryseobacterium wangxinyae]|uniref:pinensin family lanthipeptide n=1 Tax=Chryseobacterium sp. CY353 TaxID=2997334 RepID=UPI00226DAEC7|nr:pinensin family lanthipeptide [Chryseobacterium sp. CY353]MCY0971128.1 pinensin family lanthipeptide [Chryseobacterium sp. CY353]